MSNTGNATCVVIAHHPAVREGLGALLDHEGDIKVVTQDEDGLEAVSLFRIRRPHHGSADASARQGAGAPREFPQTLIVALASQEGNEGRARALAIGVRSYIRKRSQAGEAACAALVCEAAAEPLTRSSCRATANLVPFPKARLRR
jgi:two-component system, NarL family, response regulator